MNNLFFRTPSINSLFDEFFAQDERAFKSGFSLDLAEAPTGFIVTADLPGVDKSEVNVEYENDVLTISAKKTEVNEEKSEDASACENSDKTEAEANVEGKKTKALKVADKAQAPIRYLHRERIATSFERRVHIPGINPAEIKAKMQNGVLEVTLPKVVETEKRTRISIA